MLEQELSKSVLMVSLIINAQLKTYDVLIVENHHYKAAPELFKLKLNVKSFIVKKQKEKMKTRTNVNVRKMKKK